MSSPDRVAGPGLLRVMGRRDLTALVINSVIGAGVFGLPAAVAALTGVWSPLTVLIAALGIIPIALCIAEVGSRFDVAGGPYLYAGAAFGPNTGFHVGWLLLWTRLLSAGAVLNVLTAYLATLVPWVGAPAGRAITMICAVALFTAINVRGVRQAAWTVNLFTIAKLLPLVLLIVLGMLHLQSNVMATQQVAAPQWTDAVLQMVFAFAGFEVALVAAGELRRPRQDCAFALIVAMLIITAIYALVQLAVIGVLPNAAASQAPIADALGIILGPLGATVGALAATVSAYGWLTGNALLIPRLPFSMAERGELPDPFMRVHPVFRTPHVSIITCTLTALAFGLLGTFAVTATLAAIGRLVVYTVTCASLIVLRRKASQPAGFVLPAGYLFAASGIVFSIWLLSTRSFAQVWIIAGIVLAGVVARASSRVFNARAAATTPGSV